MEKKINHSTNRPLINGWYIARLVSELGFIIAVPLVIFLLFGRMIDIKIGTNVIFTLVGMGFALIFSIFIIYKKIQKISKND